MVERLSPYEIQLSCFMVLAVLSDIRECDALNLEGLALLEFRERIVYDPFGAFMSWNMNSTEPCLWMGVQCVDGKVQMLDLSGFSLQGTLAPGLRKLRYMRSIVLSNNHLSGNIPKEIGELKLLELMDLRYNNMSGTIPAEIGAMPSLKCLFLFGNNFEGVIPFELEKFDQLSDPVCRQRLQSDAAMAKDSHRQCTLMKIFKQLKNYLGLKAMSAIGKGQVCAEGEHCCHQSSNFLAESKVSRRSLEETSNLAASPAPAHGPEPPKEDNLVVLNTGAFPAIVDHPTPTATPSDESPFSPHPGGDEGSIVGYIILGLLVALALLATVTLFCIIIRQRGKRAQARPRDCGLLHRLSKVFVTGVPKLNSSELETACEDFSNIIDSFPGCLMYKGILSSGVEIAVVSTTVRSSKQWTEYAEREFKKKLDLLSRINHKNFVNLLGYCVEEEPFVRMMVFEYTPNGSVHEHLHVDGFEHLDWHLRMRIVMGTCYCLEYMHHELNPPIIIPISPEAVLLTDDYAAKIAHSAVWVDIACKAGMSSEDSKECGLNQAGDAKDNVYSLGILLLEIISARTSSVKEGNPVQWALQFLDDKENLKDLVDPSLKSFKMNELEVIGEVVRDCTNEDPSKRPSMREVTSRLRQVINISPEAATEKISPLWWAELELLSEE